MAGFLNVRADHVFEWPKPQEIGKLDLNFVRLARNTSAIKLAVISLSPFATGLLAIWIIANYRLDITAALNIMAVGTLSAVYEGVHTLLYVPDFWLWFYVTFTIGNTILPDWDDVRGLRPVLIVLGVISAILLFAGLGSQTILRFVSGPLSQTINVLSGLFAFTIGINLVVLAILSAVENTIELITGDSADFRNGKMVVMTREERLAQRMRAIEKERQARQKRLKPDTSDNVRVTGPPSIYNYPLPILGEPNKLNTTPLQRVVSSGRVTSVAGAKSTTKRAGADQIQGKMSGDDERRTQLGDSVPQLPD